MPAETSLCGRHHVRARCPVPRRYHAQRRATQVGKCVLGISVSSSTMAMAHHRLRLHSIPAANRPRRREWGAVVCRACVWLSFAAGPEIVCANVGPPSWGGQLVTEPGGVSDIDVVHETLSIDLRPLADGKPVLVDAVYLLENPADEKVLELVFASGAPGVTAFRVWLDGQPVVSEARPEVEVPERWQPPGVTPGIHGRDLDYFSHRRREVVPFAFRAAIASGEHELKVSYAADAAGYHVGEPTLVRQFAYVLAPAASWKSFGGLDLLVQVPPGWLAAVTPPLERRGDVLRERFSALPADAIALSVQAPVPTVYWAARAVGVLMLVLAVVGGGPGCWMAAHRIDQRRCQQGRSRPVWRLWLRSLGLALVWGGGVLACGLAALFSPTLLLPRGQVSQYGYGVPLALFGLILLAGLTTLAGISVSLTATLVAHRKDRPLPATPGSRG